MATSKKLTNSQLAAWIYSPKATVALLQQCYAHYALPAPVPTALADLQRVIYTHLISLTGSDTADWQPPVAPSTTSSSTSASSRPSSTPRRSTPPAAPTAPLSISPRQNLGHVKENEPLSIQMTGKGGDASKYVWSLEPIVNGSVPAWLHMNPKSGELTGTPPAGAASVSPYTFFVKLEDGKDTKMEDVVLYVDPQTVVVTNNRRNNTVVVPNGTTTVVHTGFPSWVPVVAIVALVAIVGLALLAFFALRPAATVPAAVVSQSVSLTGCLTCGSAAPAPATVVVVNGSANSPVQQDPATVKTIANAATCGCPAGNPAATFDKPLNADDNVALTLQPGLYDVEDTRLEGSIKTDGTGTHMFYLLNVPQGQTMSIPAYSDPAGRRRVWQFQPNATVQGALCEVKREAVDYANSHVNTSTTVWFFNTQLLDNGKLITAPAYAPAATIPQPLNADDNTAITLQPGLYDVEDTRMEGTIKTDGTGTHAFYLLFVPQGQTMTIPAYSDPAGRQRVWQFQSNATVEGALCEVLREATDFATQKVGSNTSVWFFSTSLMANGVAAK